MSTANGGREPGCRAKELHESWPRAIRPRAPSSSIPERSNPKWRNLDDVEVVLLQYWTEARLRIESIDPTANMVRFTGDTWRPMSWSKGWYVENVSMA